MCRPSGRWWDLIDIWVIKEESMNLYQTFNQLFATPKGMAQITGQKGARCGGGTNTQWGVCRVKWRGASG